MCNLYGYVKCYDTLKQEYVLVPVEVELEIYSKQSHWKEDMQNRRYSKRTTVYDYLVPKQEEIENEKNNLINDIIRQYEIECLKEEIDKLDEKYKKIIRLVYYKELTLTAAAKELGISTSYMSRLVKKVNQILKKALEEHKIDE